MHEAPAVIVRPEGVSAELKAQAAKKGVSVQVSDRVPYGQMFVYDPARQILGPGGLYDAFLNQQPLAQRSHRGTRQRLLDRTVRRFR